MLADLLQAQDPYLPADCQKNGTQTEHRTYKQILPAVADRGHFQQAMPIFLQEGDIIFSFVQLCLFLYVQLETAAHQLTFLQLQQY